VIRTRVEKLQTTGVKQHHLGGAMVAVTTPARTVADCFKHRNKLGIDVCVEALRETLNSRKAKLSEISEMGRMLRVGKVMKPYLEAMI
jgi:predicted transcriptional regulator of viral defense system